MEVLAGVLAAAAYGAAILGCWRLGEALADRLGKKGGEAVAAGALLATVAMVLVMNWFPSRIPAAWVLSPAIHVELSYFPPTALVVFGIGAKRIPRPESARAIRVLAAVLGLYGAVHLYLSLDARTHPSLSSVPPAGPVQGQTTHWSCGAAACVTLLKAHGIGSTEREMAELCLTMPYRGTTTARFVRGLTLKTRDAGSPLRVRAADRIDLDGLDRFPVPCILGIRGSILVGHAVVLLGREPDGRYLVADPVPVGRGRVHSVPRADLERTFTGEAVGLER